MNKTANDGGILRLIDANTNRLIEGLRVCEDIARFILNDKKATQGFKSLRHRAFGTIKKLGTDKKLLAAARDTGHDIGKSSIAPETRRHTISDIFMANIKRSEEAMRVMEEFSKLSPFGASRAKSPRCAQGDTERRFGTRRKQRSLAPSNVSSAALADNFKKMRFKLYSLEKKIIEKL